MSSIRSKWREFSLYKFHSVLEWLQWIYNMMKPWYRRNVGCHWQFAQALCCLQAYLKMATSWFEFSRPSQSKKGVQSQPVPLAPICALWWCSFTIYKHLHCAFQYVVGSHMPQCRCSWMISVLCIRMPFHKCLNRRTNMCHGEPEWFQFSTSFFYCVPLPPFI